MAFDDPSLRELVSLLQAERSQARSPVALKMDGMAEAAPSGPIQTDVPLPLSPNSQPAPAGAEASQTSPAPHEPPPVVGSPTAEAAAAIPLPSGES